MNTNIEKAGSIGYLSSLDMGAFEQPMNSWSSVDDMRMRNSACETIYDRVVIDVGTGAVYSVSELSYMNNPNGLFHVLFGDSGVGSVDENNVYRDISLENTNPEIVLNGDFSTGLTSWIVSGDVESPGGTLILNQDFTELAPDSTNLHAWTKAGEVTDVFDEGVAAVQFSDFLPDSENSIVNTLTTPIPSGAAGTNLRIKMVQSGETSIDWNAGVTVEFLDVTDTIIGSGTIDLILDELVLEKTISIESNITGTATQIRVYPNRLPNIGGIVNEVTATLFSVSAWALAATSDAYQGIALTDGEVHTLTYDIVSVDNSLQTDLTNANPYIAVIQIPGQTDPLYITKTGSYSVVFTASGTSAAIEIVSARSASAVTLDNISLKLGQAINGDYPENVWVHDKLHGVLGATNQVAPPVYLPDYATSQTPVVVFPEWGKYLSDHVVDEDENDLCGCIAAYKNFFVAGNIHAGLNNTYLTPGQDYPSMIRWSNASDNGAVPADWYVAAPESQAGQQTVGSNIGAILAMETMRDALIIYGETGAVRMTWTGGQYVFDLKPMFPKTGVFGPRCVVEYRNQHIMVTQDDVIMHDGQNIQSIADKRVRKDIFTQLRQIDRNQVCLSLIKERGEVWLSFGNVKEKVDPLGNNIAYVYSLEDNTWSKRNLTDEYVIRELPRLDTVVVDDDGFGNYTYVGINEAAGNPAPPDATPGDTSSTGYGIDSYEGVGDARYSQKTRALGDFDVYAANLDTYSRYDTGARLEGLLERRGINLTGDEQTAIVTAIYPRISGTLPVTVQVGSQKQAEGAITWKEPEEFIPGDGYRCVFKARGRRHAVRFTGSDYRLEGYSIEWAQGGKR